MGISQAASSSLIISDNPRRNMLYKASGLEVLSAGQLRIEHLTYLRHKLLQTEANGGLFLSHCHSPGECTPRHQCYEVRYLQVVHEEGCSSKMREHLERKPDRFQHLRLSAPEEVSEALGTPG